MSLVQIIGVMMEQDAVYYDPSKLIGSYRQASDAIRNSSRDTLSSSSTRVLARKQGFLSRMERGRKGE